MQISLGHLEKDILDSASYSTVVLTFLGGDGLFCTGGMAGRTFFRQAEVGSHDMGRGLD